MFGTQHLALFVVSGLLLNITPGQDTLYIVGRTMAQGRQAGLLSVLGITSGSVVHTIAAALGLSAILVTSSAAFTVVKLAGAAYLIYLGTRMLTASGSRGARPPSPVFETESSLAIYRAAALTNVLNPKVALFFLAFLPQFVAADAPSRVAAFLFLGAIFIVNGTLWCLVLVWMADAVNGRLKSSSSVQDAIHRLTGAVFVALGVKLAVSR